MTTYTLTVLPKTSFKQEQTLERVSQVVVNAVKMAPVEIVSAPRQVYFIAFFSLLWPSVSSHIKYIFLY